MTPEMKERWIAALESGKYKHGALALATANALDGITKHCCLGVLAEECKDELKAAGVPVEWKGGNLMVDRNGGDFSLIVKDIVGIKHTDMCNLMTINDAPLRRGYAAQISYIKDNL